MRTKRLFTGALAVALCLSAVSSRTQAQETAARKAKSQTVTPAAGSNPVVGSGTAGHITRWTGVEGSNTYVVGNSNIFQDKFGKVGIGTTTPTSLLTVQGMIEITMGGLKFPDGTLQTTAFNPSQVVRSLNGLTGDIQLAAGANITITPTGNTLTIAATNALIGVAHNATLTGNGTAASPLGVAVPLNLTGGVATDGILKVTNTGQAGSGVVAVGGSMNSLGGDGVVAVGGSGGPGNAGDGVLATGGSGGGAGVRGNGGAGAGTGVRGNGGDIEIGNTGTGGPAIVGLGGRGRGAGSRGGSGIRGTAGSGLDGALVGLAAEFNGDVDVTGNVAVSGTLSKGGGSFKIDHPLDPENKYLYHSFVESPDMKNIYDGVIVLDDRGEAVVQLPEWFEALNDKFRYTLTAIGAPAPGLYIAEKVADNRFKIAGGQPGIEVSWMVTGIRRDAYASKNRIPVEVEKPKVERGYYLHPEAFNQPEEKSINWARDPEGMMQLKQRRFEAEQIPKRKQP